jgi:hypothetical protein
MATVKKPKMILQEKYKKGVIANKSEIKRLVDDNFEKITMELRETIKYDDGSESVVVEIRVK